MSTHPLHLVAGCLMGVACSSAAHASVHQDHARHPPEMQHLGMRTPALPPSDVAPPERWVYGYYAPWAGELEDLDWPRLSHVAIFSVDMNADGTFSGGSTWSRLGAAAVELGAPHGTRVHLTLTCFDDDVMTAVLTNESRRLSLVEALGDTVDSVGAHGVSVDCEGVPGALRDPLTRSHVHFVGRVVLH